MITTVLRGGMGNQMFEYAMGYARSQDHHDSLGIGTWMLTANRKYQLDQWQGITERVITKDPKEGQMTVYENGMPYDQKTVNFIRNDNTLIGYWQTEKYFSNYKNELKKIFIPKDLSFKDSQIFNEIIQAPISVSVHVRRGDYLNSPHKEFHGILPKEYYDQAITILNEKLTRTEIRLEGLFQEKVITNVIKPKFFIFSDDPEWCNENLWYENSTILAPRQEAQDIYMMSLCNHAVIANSSFSWWGAELGETDSQIVIVPQKWFDQANEKTWDLIPDRWIRI